MNRCPTCGMPLEDGLEFCAPTKTMQDRPRGNVHAPTSPYVFLGCAMLVLPTVMHVRQRTGKIKRLTDSQRAEKAWGADCLMSEFGPLPTEREMQGKYVDHSAWERPESHSTRVQRNFVNGLKHDGVG